MANRPILAPATSIAEMSIDKLIEYLKTSEQDFISNFSVLNSNWKKIEYLKEFVEFRQNLILVDKNKFSSANFFRNYSQFNFEYFSSKRSDLTEEFVDILRSDIKDLYNELIDELLYEDTEHLSFDFKRLNEFKYFLNQIILNKYNYCINRLIIILDEDFLADIISEDVTELAFSDDKFIEENMEGDFSPESELKKSIYKVYIKGVETKPEDKIFEKFIKYSRRTKGDIGRFGELKSQAVSLNDEKKIVINLNSKYILNELKKDFNIGKQTYYNYFTFDDQLIIKDRIDYKQQKLNDLENALKKLKSESTENEKEVNNLKSDIRLLREDIKVLEREYSKKTKNSSRSLLIEKCKKIEFDKKFFLNLGMYLQLETDDLEAFINLNGYSINSLNEYDTFIRVMHENYIDIKTINFVLKELGYKTLSISEERLKIMTKTSYEISKEYINMDKGGHSLLSVDDRIYYYRNIEAALNLIETFFSNRNYNEKMFRKLYSANNKLEYDLVLKEYTQSLASGSKLHYSDPIKRQILSEFEKYSDSYLIMVNQIFKTDEKSKIGFTFTEWRDCHKSLLKALESFDMYYIDFKAKHPKEVKYAIQSVNNLIKRLERRYDFINTKLKSYTSELSSLERLPKKTTHQRKRIEKLILYIEVLNDYEEEGMFYLRDQSKNGNIKFSDGIKDTKDILEYYKSQITIKK